MSIRLAMAMVAVALWMAQPGMAAPSEVLLGADLPGRKVRLGPEAPVVVLLDESGFVVPLDLPPGRVRVAVQVRDNGKGDVVRQRTVSLSVGGQTASQTVESLAHGLELSVDFVHRVGPVEVKLSLGSLTEAMRRDLASLQGKDALATAPTAPGGLSAPEEPELTLEESEQILDLGGRQAPVLLIERILVAPLSGPVIVSSVGSDRITYAPGAKGTLFFALENLGETPQTVEFAVAQLADLEVRTPLEAGRLEMPAGGTVTRDLPFVVGEALWGRGFEVMATTSAGRDLAAHAVSVVTDPWMVAMHGQGVPMFGSDAWTEEQAQAEAERIVRANLEQYNNVYEKFAWAACDYSEMTPDDDGVIHSGQTQYTSKRSAYQTLHAAFKARGIHAITYGKACGGGLAGLEYSHAHPERMNIFGHAGFAHESFDVDVIDRMLEGRYRQHGRDEDFWQMWISCWTHYGNQATTFYGCDEIANSAKLLGWDGVRYDGAWEVWGDPAGTARLLAATEARIADQVPGFVFGYNHGGPHHNERAGALTDVVMAAMARGGGLVMSEYYRGLHGAVKTNILHLQNMGDAVRAHGGYFLCIFDDNTPWNAALVMAAGARPMGGGGLRKFATRYSQYIFDPALRRLENPAALLRPLAEPGFRWDAFVYERQVDETRSQLILQLVNVSNETTFGDQYTRPTKLNPPQRDLAFDLLLPPGCRAASVFATDDAETLQPMPARLDGSRLHIPTVRLWTLVVVEMQRDAAAAAAALSAASARAEGEPAESRVEPSWPAGLRPAVGPAAELDLNWEWHVHQGRRRRPEERSEAKVGETLTAEDLQAINQGRVRITPEVLDKVLALGLPPDTAPGEGLFQAADFAAHRGGRDAAGDPAPVAPLALARDGRPDILHARGAFAHRHRLPEAFARLPGAVVDDACVRSTAALGALSATNPGSLQPWPDRAGLASRDVVVLDAVPAPAFSLAQRRDLRDFVAGGGGLLATGSWYSLSKGEYDGSFVEEALPVRCKQATYLRRVRPEAGGLVFTPAYERLLGVKPPPLPGGAAVEWVSQVEPKPGAEVLATTAAGIPVLVAGTFGAGRSVVWAVANSGQPAAPWWESAWWPEVATACLHYLARGAEAVSPPDEELAKRLAEARAMVAEASVTALLDEGLGMKLEANSEAEVAARLRLLLRDGNEAEARAAVAYLLENPDRVEPLLYPELTHLATAKLTATPEWAALAARFVKAPPHLLDDLVAEMAAAAMPELKAATVMGWKVSDLVRLRCLAAVADPAARPELERRNRALDQQEAAWQALRWEQGGLPVDIYRTRLQRPFVTWALLQCGQDDAETIYAFARACLDLPYYHWRQHWVLANRQASVIEAQRSGGTGAEQQSAVRASQAAIRDLEHAMEFTRPWFAPERLGATPEARRAVARALAEADCRKALPLALAYIRATPREHLDDFEALDSARLDSLRQLYRARRGQLAAR